MMSKIVRTAATFIAIFALVYGLYVILHTHLTPGGGFQGGAVTASGPVLLIVAFGSQYMHRSIKESYLSILRSIGCLIFTGAAFGGIAITFFYNFLVGSPILGHVPAPGPNSGDLWTGGVIPIMNLGVGFNVVAGLCAVLIVMALATEMTEVE